MQRCSLIIGGALALLSGTLGSPTEAEHRNAIVIEPLVTLDDADGPILGQPRWASRDTSGRFIIGDRSDRDIKVYDPDGRRSLTIGRAGEGPGEFSYLSANALLDDSIVAYDFSLGRLTIFDSDGTLSTTVRFDGAPPWTVRVAEDATLLLVGHPARGGELLRLAAADGSIAGGFFPLPDRWLEHRALLQHMVVFADVHQEIIFAGMFGSARLRVFDRRGALLAEAPVDPERPLEPLDALFTANRDRLRAPDGSWVHHGKRVLMSVVATADSTALLQVAPYDAELGTDPLEGGTLLAVRYADGALEAIGRVDADWGLVGRDAKGRALLMRYDPASTDRDRYQVGRLIVNESVETPAR